MSRNIRPLSKAQSEHECVTSKRHAKDKKKNEAWRSKAWVPDELPGHSEKPPGLQGRWNDLRPGTSYRWVAGIMIECKPAELLQAREALRKKFPSYQGMMIRKTKKGETREAWVNRKLTNPVSGCLITLAPWQTRLLKEAPAEERDKVLKKAWEAAIKELHKAGWQPFGADAHEDTAQPHATISCLRINETTKRLIEMRGCSKWTIVMDRLDRAGIKHPDEKKAQWFHENMERSGVTPNLAAHRAADQVLSDWIKSKKVTHLEGVYLKEYADWQRQWIVRREAKLAMRVARRVSRIAQVAIMGLVTAKLMKLAGEISGQGSGEEERKIKDQCKNAAAMDRIS